MEPIDSAHETFVALRTDIAAIEATLVTEADVRSKVIDPIFTQVLGWAGNEYLAENATADGFVDYVFQISERSRLVVEAKRDSRPLGCAGRDTGRGFVLDGPIFRDEAAKEGIRQAIRYCGMKNAELACVTNGREWIVFRGNRLGDGSDTMKGTAFVFPSLQGIQDKFKLFYALLSRDDIERHEFRAYFQEVEGRPIRSSNFKKALRDMRSARLMKSSQLSSDVDRVMTAFFDRLTGDEDPGLLAECFVETSESREADTKLARISEDIVGKIRNLDTSDSTALVELIERATQAKRHEFVVIVGTKGAGKTTFITRFFTRILSPDLAAECISCRINLADSSGDGTTIISWLDQHLLAALEDAVFAGSPPEFKELEGIFYDEYTRLRKGPWNRLYESDRTGFQIKFGDRVEEMREHKPNDYIRGLVRHIVNSRKKLPVIVFDNADHFHISFQEQVYQYARSIYESALCLIMLPITDRTSWQLSRHGALQSFEHEALYLPTPPTGQVIRRRIEFMQTRLAESERLRPDDRYFVKRGISLSLKDLSAFTRSLQGVFLQTDETARWIGNLSNNDVRRSLKLARQFVTSGHLEVEDLLKAHIAGTTRQISKRRAALAIMRGNYDVYGGQTEFVQNTYAMSDVIDSSPLLGLSILQLLEDAPEDEALGHMLDLSQIDQYCEAMGYDSQAVQVWTDALLESALCHDYDPTVTSVSTASRLEITPAGKQHLYWARSNFDYVSTMADITPVRDRETFDKLRDAIADAGGGWREKSAVFIDYLLAEDANYCTVPDHEAYEGQRRARRTLADTRDRLRQDTSARR